MLPTSTVMITNSTQLRGQQRKAASHIPKQLSATLHPDTHTRPSGRPITFTAPRPFLSLQLPCSDPLPLGNPSPGETRERHCLDALAGPTVPRPQSSLVTCNKKDFSLA